MTENKEERPVARLPHGFMDAVAGDVLERSQMIDTILATYRLYGFAPLETPAVEYLDALGKFLPDKDAPDEGVFALRDDDDQWIALRYDLTAPLARTVAQYGTELPRPYRRYQFGPVWRREKPGPGRFRQFYQCDFDTVGSGSMAVDAEVCSILSDALGSLGIAQDEYEVRVNNRKVLAGILGRSGVSDPDRQLEVLRTVDKLDRLGVDGVTDLLGAGRKDPSGDFTKGAELSAEQIDLVLAFVQAGDPSRQKVLATLSELVGGDPVGREGIEEMERIDALVGAGGPMPQVVFEPTVVRGLAYYTGPVFEASLTFEVQDESGKARSFGSVAGGGRYDDLVQRFTGESVPACGASIGVDRLLAALRARRSATAGVPGPVVVTVMDADRMTDYQAMVAELRAGGVAAELYLGDGGLQKQLRYADKRSSPVAIIAGGDEFTKGEVVVKDLVLGARRAQEITDRDEWRTDRTAQQSVSRSELLETVRAVIDRG